MKNIKQIFTGRLRTVTCIIVVIMFVLIVVTQLAAAEDSARRDAHSRFSQIEHILAENEADRETVRESFNADNLRSARIAAYMIQNHPDILLDDERMRELAALLGVEEIWVFDDEGTIFAGTTPDFYGLTFDSGEQLAFFKPMLEDKTLELCQDIMPRTADGKLFQYSAIWNDEGTAIVQVGRSAANAAMVMERFDLSYIFSLLRVNMEVDYYAIDSETGLISGATDEHYIGKDLSEAGFDMETVAGHGDGFHAVVAGIPSYCVFTGMGPNLIGRVIPDSVLYSGLVQKCVELIVMLVAAALVLIFVVSRYVDRLVIKNIYHVNEKLGAITAGRLDERVELRNSAEFSALSDYINGMVSSLHEKVREKEEVFDIVAQHSNRILYSYDLASRTTHPLDTAGGKKDVLAHLYTGDYTDEALTENSAVMPDSVGDVRRFFYDIHSGVPSGELKIHIRLEDGRPAWYHFKYSSIFVGGKPVSALISVTDITEEHEHELAHLRFERSMGEDVEQHMGYLEADLVLDYIEKHKGRHYLNLRSFEGGSYTSYCENGFVGLAEEERAAAQEVYSKDNLIDACRRGMHRLDNVWSMAAGGDRKWVRISVELVEDPLNGHVKMFATLTDVTAEQEERMAVSRRADYDAMTGLLRRDVGEARIKEYLSDSGRKGGILITLDLDDLKGINDTLGHKQGDRAIIGIATVLKSHFRRDDILVRAGGDEFIVFLPDAAHNVESVDVSMTALLQKLSRIFVGEGSERSIHCSAGCAVDADGDSYDTLFSRADTALYHVKRSGKNNFAFYVPEMDREDYEFRAKRLLSMQGRAPKNSRLRSFSICSIQ